MWWCEGIHRALNLVVNCEHFRRLIGWCTAKLVSCVYLLQVRAKAAVFHDQSTETSRPWLRYSCPFSIAQMSLFTALQEVVQMPSPSAIFGGNQRLPYSEYSFISDNLHLMMYMFL